MIATEEYDTKSMKMNADSIIYDNNKGFRFSFFDEECFKLCSYEYIRTVVKGGLNHNKRHDVAKFLRRYYYLQKTIMLNTLIIRKNLLVKINKY